MNTKLIFLLLCFTVLNCRDKNTSNVIVVNNADSTLSSMKSLDSIIVEITFDQLQKLIENKEVIPQEYLKNEVINFGRSLPNHEIINETDNYLLVKGSSIHEAGAEHYYLLSFSKETGQVVDFIGIGAMAEGVEPFTIKWYSDSVFSSIDYQHELLEDEEGIYYAGDLIDSTIVNYNIASNGKFNVMK